MLARCPDDAPGGPVYVEALGRFRKLFAQETNKGTDDYLVSALMNQYRAHLKATRKSGAPGVFEIMAQGFTGEYGKYRVRDLKPHRVEDWLGKQTDRWNDTTKAHAGTLVLAPCRGRGRRGSSRPTRSAAGRTCPNRCCGAARPGCRKS